MSDRPFYMRGKTHLRPANQSLDPRSGALSRSVPMRSTLRAEHAPTRSKGYGVDSLGGLYDRHGRRTNLGAVGNFDARATGEPEPIKRMGNVVEV
jgi:hypothetical protein